MLTINHGRLKLAVPVSDWPTQLRGKRQNEIDGFTLCETYLEKEVQKRYMKSTSLHGATSLEACEAPSHKRLR